MEIYRDLDSDTVGVIFEEKLSIKDSPRILKIIIVVMVSSRRALMVTHPIFSIATASLFPRMSFEVKVLRAKLMKVR